MAGATLAGARRSYRIEADVIIAIIGLLKHAAMPTSENLSTTRIQCTGGTCMRDMRPTDCKTSRSEERD
jgi:hypothetical protein